MRVVKDAIPRHMFQVDVVFFAPLDDRHIDAAETFDQHVLVDLGSQVIESILVRNETQCVGGGLG
ncbi:hypothetical protein D9M69_733600 [compost metagenome]